MASPRAGLSATLAVLLSLLWPGLGQAYQRRYRLALIYALPMLVVAGYALLALVQRGPEGIALDLLDPSHGQTAVILLTMAGLWHVVAMVDAWQFARRSGSPSRLAAGVLVLAAGVVLGGYGYVDAVAWSLSEAGGRIFVGSLGGDLPLPGVEDETGGTGLVGSIEAASGSPDAAASPEPAASGKVPERISVLLIGIDKRPGRSHALTDTLMLASADPATGKAAMISIPEDLGRLPLYFGGTYTDRINTLLAYARAHQGKFPDKPTAALLKEVGYLLGTPVTYYAAVDLAGFVKLVDLVGGVTVDNPKEINDPRYGGWTDGRAIGFHLPAGRQDLDAQEALAFVRSTLGSGDNDFTRARRQQILLLALREKLSSPEMLPKLPAILGAAGDAVKTNVPATRIEDLMAILTGVDSDAVERVVLGPPYATKVAGGSGMLEPVMDRWRELSRQLFGEDSDYAGEAAAASPSVTP